jgi:hypothetical protein
VNHPIHIAHPKNSSYIVHIYAFCCCTRKRSLFFFFPPQKKRIYIWTQKRCMYILYSNILVPDVDVNVPILQTDDDDDSFEEGPEI